MNTSPNVTATAPQDAHQRRKERAMRILQEAFVVRVELRPSGFLRREWLTVHLEDGSRITGEVYRGVPIVRWIAMCPENEGRWCDGEEPVPGTPLGELARSVVNEALRAHAGAARVSGATPREASA